MEANQLEHLALLRAVVGFLGEKGQHAWWGSSLFSPGSDAFLSPVFPRTQVLAQCQGVTSAAALVHDKRIGVGRVYHLFRLPESIEQGIHNILYGPDVCKEIRESVATTERAMSFLHKTADSQSTKGVGPTRVGTIDGVNNLESWKSVAALYVDGFKNNNEVYPYFTDGK